MTETLKHFGILGMKWGVRRVNPSGDRVAVDALRKKNKKELSNAELEKAIKRLRLEKEYESLNKKTLSDGQKIWKDAFSEIAKQQAKEFITGVGAKIVKDAFTTILTGVAGSGANRSSSSGPSDFVDSYFVNKK